MPKHVSRSRQLAAKVIHAALVILVEKGGEAPGRDVISAIETRVKFDDWDKEVYEKSGYTRWKSILHFFSIDLIKAGLLIKKQGVWYSRRLMRLRCRLNFCVPLFGRQHHAD